MLIISGASEYVTDLWITYMRLFLCKQDPGQTL